jgi:hypothetical protein
MSTTGERRRFLTTTNVAAALCLVGVLAVFLPWADTSYQQLLSGNKAWFYHTLYGFQFWPADIVAGLLFALLLFLIVTSPFRPVPVWRTVVLFLVAAAAAGSLVCFALLRERLCYQMAHPEAGSPGTLLNVNWLPGPFFTALPVVGLFVVGAVEIRDRIAHHLAAKELRAQLGAGDANGAGAVPPYGHTPEAHRFDVRVQAPKAGRE